MTEMSYFMGGRSSAIQAVRELVAKVTPTDATVPMSGESGSGEELVAHAIHARSARDDDVVSLAEHFLSELNIHHGAAKSFSNGARQTLSDYSWPGDVRELKNAIERAYNLCVLELELQPMNIHATSADRAAAANSDGGIQVPIGSSLAQVERWLIEATLAHCAGNKNRAARTLGCSLKTLYNKLAAYERQGMGAGP